MSLIVSEDEVYKSMTFAQLWGVIGICADAQRRINEALGEPKIETRVTSLDGLRLDIESTISYPNARRR